MFTYLVQIKLLPGTIVKVAYFQDKPRNAFGGLPPFFSEDDDGAFFNVAPQRHTAAEKPLIPNTNPTIAWGGTLSQHAKCGKWRHSALVAFEKKAGQRRKFGTRIASDEVTF